MSDTRVVIIGGGIAGLAAAHRLLGELPAARITVIEREAVLGGKLRTDHVEGFTIEAGPDSFLAAKPETRELATSLGLGARLRGTRPASPRAYVSRDGRLHPIPEGLSGLVPGRLGPVLSSPLLSWHGKARFALDLILPRRRSDADETIADFVSRRLGREAYDWLVQPLLAGVYGGDGDTLSADAIMPELRRRERAHGSILRAARPAPPRMAGGASVSGFLTFEFGMQELVDALVASLRGVDVRLGTVAARIERDGAAYSVRLADGTSIAANAVIVATPANVAGRQCAPLDGQLSLLLARIPFGSCATVSLAFGNDAPGRGVRGHGYLRARAEPGSALAVTWVSRKWEHRAPEGCALVRVFLDGSHAERDDDAALVNAARAELATAGVTAVPLFARVRRWTRGMPQYAPGHRALVAEIARAAAQLPGFALAGNSYDGVGISDAIRSAHAACATILPYIANHERETVS